MEDKVKKFFEDLLKETKLRELATVEVQTAYNQIFVDIDYGKPLPEEQRKNRKSAYLKFKFPKSYFEDSSIKDIPRNKIIEKIENFNFERTTTNKFSEERAHEVWLIEDSNTISLEKSFP